MLELVLVPVGIKVQVPPGGSSLLSVCLAAKITSNHPRWARGTLEPPRMFPGGPGDEEDNIFPLISAFEFFPQLY